MEAMSSFIANDDKWLAKKGNWDTAAIVLKDMGRWKLIIKHNVK